MTPELDRNGYAFADLVLTEAQCERIAEELPALSGEGRGGVRDLIAHPTVVRLLEDERFRAVVGRELVAVKATLFDKTAEANWRVQWHQDRVIRHGSVRIEPSEGLLAEMLAVRIHLDACDAENGPLRVIPRSHRRGKLADDALARMTSEGSMIELYAPRGAMLFVRPLLVHASSPARSPRHRRVLHIDFAPRNAEGYLLAISAQMANGYPEHCVIHACRIAMLLLERNERPWIASIRDVDGEMHHPLIPQRFLGTGSTPAWNVHYVCCVGDRVYDPLLGEPCAIEQFTTRVFGREIAMKEAVSAEDVIALGTFEALKQRLDSLRMERRRPAG